MSAWLVAMIVWVATAVLALGVLAGILYRLRSFTRRVGEASADLLEATRELESHLARLSDQLRAARKRIEAAVVPPGAPSPPRSFLVVHREKSEVVRVLAERLGERAVVEVIRDRRVGERRTHPQPVGLERRLRERRQPPSLIWSSASADPALGVATRSQAGPIVLRPGLEALQALSRHLAEGIGALERTVERASRTVIDQSGADPGVRPTPPGLH